MPNEDHEDKVDPKSGQLTRPPQDLEMERVSEAAVARERDKTPASPTPTDDTPGEAPRT